MSKRTELNVLFNVASKLLNRPIYSAKGTERRRLKATLHIPFEQERLKQLLSYLKANHYNLYLGCLITYGTFLRPHKEVRLLTVGHFKKDFSEIHLSGDENKSGKIRIVSVADYIREEVVSTFSGLPEDINIFSYIEYLIINTTLIPLGGECGRMPPSNSKRMKLYIHSDIVLLYMFIVKQKIFISFNNL
jgi:hypothetical protein